MAVSAVFVCSTKNDLSEERQGVLEAIAQVELQSDSMEFFGARDDRPLRTCLSEVRRSNILVVIVAHTYGSIASEVQISYSEAEYEEGHRLRKPCLVYLKDERVCVLPADYERDPVKLQLLLAWKARLNSRHMVATFTNRADLTTKVAADLKRLIGEADPFDDLPPTGASDPAVAAAGLVRMALDSGVPANEIEEAFRYSIMRLVRGYRAGPPHVFLSFAIQDQQAAEELGRRLMQNGLVVDTGEPTAAALYVPSIEQLVASADAIVLLLSGASARSSWTRREQNLAMRRHSVEDVPVIPVLLQDSDEISPLLRQYRWLDFRGGEREFDWEALKSAVLQGFPDSPYRSP